MIMNEWVGDAYGNQSVRFCMRGFELASIFAAVGLSVRSAGRVTAGVTKQFSLGEILVQ